METAVQIETKVEIKTASQHRAWLLGGSTEAQLWCQKKIIEYDTAGKLRGNDLGCWLLDLQPSKEGGYIQLPAKGGKTITAHVSALIADGRPCRDPGLQASHRCGQPTCVFPPHLVWETAAENNARKGCLGTIQCGDCSRLIELCTHGDESTRCIRPIKQGNAFTLYTLI